MGLILIVIIFVVLIVTGVIKAPGLYRYDSNSNYNYNTNRNSNFNSNANLNSNSDTSSSSSTISEDGKHRLLLAASFVNDTELMQKVIRKIGFGSDAGRSDEYAQFIREHADWAIKNSEFVSSVNSPEKAPGKPNDE